MNQTQPTSPSENNSQISQITPADLARRVKKYLAMGSSLQEIKADAIEQGISEKLWNDAVLILHPKKNGSALKIFVTIVLVLFFGLLGTVFYLFTQTDFYKKIPGSKPLAFFQELQKDPIAFPKNILLGRLDLVKSLETLNRVEENIPVQIHVQDVLETQTGNSIMPLPVETRMPTASPETVVPTISGEVIPPVKKPTGVMRIKR